MRLIFHHSEVLWDGTVRAIFEVVGGKYKGCCMITGRAHVKLTLHHSTEQNGIVTGHFNVPGYESSLCALVIGRSRLKLRYRILQNLSKNPEGHVYATIRHTDWAAVQDRFTDAGPEYRSKKGFGFVTIPSIRIGQLNESSAS